MDLLEVIVFAVGIFFFVYLLIMQPHKVSGMSMHPNFPDKEFLLTEKVTYYTRKPQRGDVVVFEPPTSNTDEYIKRIIALPGEKIMIRGGRVYINDKLLVESYLKDDILTESEDFLAENQEFTVPEGQYFVLGDNRPRSSDSRAFGPISPSKITGRAWIVYWPLSNAGVVKKPLYEF